LIIGGGKQGGTGACEGGGGNGTNLRFMLFVERGVDITVEVRSTKFSRLNLVNDSFISFKVMYSGLENAKLIILFIF
jgi:hypothetical protein